MAPPNAGAHMESRFSEIFKRNSTKTWHYIFASAAPRPQQNQRVMSCAQARTVEDGQDSVSVYLAQGRGGTGSPAAPNWVFAESCRPLQARDYASPAIPYRRVSCCD